MGRLEYFSWWLVQVPIWLGLCLTMGFTAGVSAMIRGGSVADLPDTLWTYLALLACFPVMLFFLVVIVPRRCHDRGKVVGRYPITPITAHYLLVNSHKTELFSK